MTFIRPAQGQNFLNTVILLLIAALACGAVLLIAFYNRLVDARAGLDAATAQFQGYQAQNAELRDKILSLLDGAHVNELVQARSLSLAKTPEYVQANPQWRFVSEQ